MREPAETGRHRGRAATASAGAEQPDPTPARPTPARPVAASIQAQRLDPGLHLVATPIGTARDITLRALDVLNNADVLAAEDTRVLRHLMEIHGIALRGRRLIAYHDHNGDRARPAIMRALADGFSVAYASDAGTPLVADPGYRLARDAAEAGARVHAVPGPSAMLAALSVAGLPSDRFIFVGFSPSARGARKRWIAEWAGIDATVILFESPRRVRGFLEDLGETEPDREIVICRELTKKFEEIIRGTPLTLLETLPDEGLRGEVVILCDRPVRSAPDQGDVTDALRAALERGSVKDAATEIAARFGLPRKEIYAQAIALAKERE
ncbi:16S rRNA (cytidine(1402)-2'-O)-methyltransferase [Paracoccus sp. DMF-8]|uniref:16S rRNA (cytidine(1402)-2'-O)-methyltransferase n=1 Tax=Paracoccus sp. DMF-8 TaxID=3019445 RepID=UPI0023E44ADF|nr:16S rRNA (cytidine(1402)-2'-O)-methyltransferase [Paracoccus sp. DMF-8]MDF3608502.1 16S rRNA (cytidine(1402)-2'-O)-methyltransferase [Paracoccus sp. DMF-8]